MIEAPPQDTNDAPPLPVMLAIRQGTGQADSTTGGAELDVVNTSDEALTITVLVADVPRAQLFVPPRVEEHLGTESGVELESGSWVTLRSPGYHELTRTVP